MTEAQIPAACPRCGSRTLRVQVLTWAVFRDGRFEGLIVDGDYVVANDSAIRCDNDDCDWQDPDPVP